MDALNVLNHPTLAVDPNNAGGADFMGAPSTATLTTSAYNTWATANGQPLSNTTGGTVYNGIVHMVNAQKRAGGALPSNFYRIAANSYTGFGDLYNHNTPRCIFSDLRAKAPAARPPALPLQEGSFV